MADRYWVGTGVSYNWNDTANWSSSQGGLSGASVPTSSDNVFFPDDHLYLQFDIAAPECRDFTISGNSLRVTKSASSTKLSIYGNTNINSSTSVAYYVTGMDIEFRGAYSDGTFTVNTGNVNLNANLIFNANTNPNVTYILTSNLYNTSFTVNVANANLDLSSYTLRVDRGNSDSLLFNENWRNNNRFLYFSNSNVIIGNSRIYSNSTTGNGTLTSTGNLVVVSDNQWTAINSLTITPTVATTNIAHTYTPNLVTNNFTLTTALAGVSTAGYLAGYSISNLIVNNTATIGTTSGTLPYRRVFLNEANIRANNVQITNTDFCNVTVTGNSAPWSGLGLSNFPGVTNNTTTGVTFDTPKTVYYVTSESSVTWSNANWSLSSGGSTSINNFPLYQDTIIFDNNSIPSGGTITIGLQSARVGNLDMSQRTYPLTISSGLYLYGNIWFSNSTTYGGMYIRGSGDQYFSVSGTATYTSISLQPSLIDMIGLPLSGTPSGNIVLANTFVGTGDITLTSTDTLINKNLNLANNSNHSIGGLTTSSFNTIYFGSANLLTVTGTGGLSFGAGPVFSGTGKKTFLLVPTGNVTYTNTGTYAQDTAPNISFAGNGNVSMGGTRVSFRDLDLSGSAGTTTFPPLTTTIYGNFTVGKNSRIGGGGATSVLSFASTKTQYIDGNNIPLNYVISIAQPTATPPAQAVLLTPLNTTQTLRFSSYGNLDLNRQSLRAITITNQTLTRGNIFFSNANITLTGTATVWTYSSLLQMNGNGRVLLSNSAAKTFAGGSQYWPIYLVQAGTGNLTITGSNTFDGISNTAYGNIFFTGGTTNTVNEFSVTGASGSVVNVSSTNTTVATINKARPWNVGTHSTNVSNNTGLSFTADPWAKVDYLRMQYITGTYNPQYIVMSNGVSVTGSVTITPY